MHFTDPFAEHQRHLEATIDYHGHDEPAAFTLSDFLDAYFDPERISIAHDDGIAHFERHRSSFHRVIAAVNLVRALTPEERAEFDRRTT